MTRKGAWTVVFLGGTAVVVGMELVAALDGDADTRPWTDYLTDLPGPVLALLVAALMAWLPIHLYRAWREKHKEN